MSNESIAERLGFPQLQVGSHTVAGTSDTHSLLNAYWLLTACPTFRHGWKVGLVALEDVADRVPSFCHHWLAFLAADSFFASAEVLPDTEQPALFNITPFQADFPSRFRMRDGRWLTGYPTDGISYILEWQSLDIHRGQLTFGNPRTAPMTAMERWWFHLAEKVQQAKGSDQITELLEVWRLYLGRRAGTDD